MRDMLLTESKTQKLRRGNRLKSLFYLTLFMAVLFVACVLIMLCCSGWTPGNQAEIYRQYKAHRFEAEFDFPSPGEIATK